jgi:quercetin dioxygenase-like cupin family protein
MATPSIKASGEGERRWFYGGGVHTWKVTEAESGGSISAFEDVMTEGKNTPWHMHPHSEEASYLLEGQCRVRIGDDERVVSAGATWFVPRGTPHAFAVLSPIARVLAIQTPGTAGRFYWDASEPAQEEDGDVDFARIGAAAAGTGVTQILGPPPFDPGS